MFVWLLVIVCTVFYPVYAMESLNSLHIQDRVSVSAQHVAGIQRLLHVYGLQPREEDYYGDYIHCLMEENEHRPNCDGVCNRQIMVIVEQGQVVGYARFFMIGDVVMVPRLVAEGSSVMMMHRFDSMLEEIFGEARLKGATIAHIFINANQTYLSNLFMRKGWQPRHVFPQGLQGELLGSHSPSMLAEIPSDYVFEFPL